MILMGASTVVQIFFLILQVGASCRGTSALRWPQRSPPKCSIEDERPRVRFCQRCPAWAPFRTEPRGSEAYTQRRRIRWLVSQHCLTFSVANQPECFPKDGEPEPMKFWPLTQSRSRFILRSPPPGSRLLIITPNDSYFWNFFWLGSNQCGNYWSNSTTRKIVGENLTRRGTC